MVVIYISFRSELHIHKVAAELTVPVVYKLLAYLGLDVASSTIAP